MQTNMQKKGFTLIELLVVIVIIGILATISVATFSGYFKKARDAERKNFVNQAKTIVIASQVSSDTADYDLGSATNAGTDAALDAILLAQDYAVPTAKNSHAYYYVTDAVVDGTATISGAAIVVCGEETADEEIFATLGDAGGALGTCSGATFTPTTAATSDDLNA